MTSEIHTAHVANPDTVVDDAHDMHVISEFSTAHNIDSAHPGMFTESPNRARPHQQTSPGPNRSSGDPVVTMLTGLLTPLVNHLYSVLVHHGIARPLDIEPSLATTTVGAL